MGEFPGFPSRQQHTALPNLFFTGVLPLIDDIAELKVALHLFWRLAWKKGYPRFVTRRELAADLDLMSGLALEGKDPVLQLASGLRQATARGTFLHLALGQDDSTDDLYFLNTEADRRAIEGAQRGTINLGAMPRAEPLAAPAERRNIYTLYEENIGILTPLIAEELKEAERLYPYPWIEEAFREAVRAGGQRWRYILAILERWTAEGRGHGTPARGDEHVSSGNGAAGTSGGYLVKRRRR